MIVIIKDAMNDIIINILNYINLSYYNNHELDWATKCNKTQNKSNKNKTYEC